jgi:SAM-dependent methyltransferase
MNYWADCVESLVDSLRDELCFPIEDDRFDQVWPLRLRKLSPLHWTPIVVASHASKLLVTKPGTRVLDIGCGPGKFCLIAAALTDGYFTGVEQRREDARPAQRL